MSYRFYIDGVVDQAFSTANTSFDPVSLAGNRRIFLDDRAYLLTDDIYLPCKRLITDYDKCEFITAVTGTETIIADIGPDGICKGLDRQVTFSMAILIIDVLQTVEIRRKQSKPLSFILIYQNVIRYFLHKTASVIETCKVIRF